MWPWTTRSSANPIRSDERRLNIQIAGGAGGGTYANFANVSFSRYEFTLTFARIEHEVEEGDVPGAVVAGSTPRCGSSRSYRGACRTRIRST